MKPSLITVAEDIAYLRLAWSPEVTNADLRRGSAVLRRLLVEGVLGQAWRSTGQHGEPAIPCTEIISDDHRHRPRSHIVSAGGGTIGIAGVEVYFGPDAIVPEDERHLPPTRDRVLRLTEFLASASVVIDGDSVSRREVVKYHANVLGGVHLGLSSRRRKAEQDLIRRIERMKDRFVKILDRDLLYFELLCIGRQVVDAPDVLSLEQILSAGS